MSLAGTEWIEVVIIPEHWKNVVRSKPRRVATNDIVSIQVEGGFKAMRAPCDGYELEIGDDVSVFVPMELLPEKE